MFEGPEFRHLRYFVAVAEEHSFGRGAQRLHVSQPALSEQIKQFESGLGIKLFLRSHHGAALTTHGRELLPYARRTLSMRAQIVGLSCGANQAKQPSLRLGYSPFVNHGLVSEVITGYEELAPGGRLQNRSECSGRLVEMVREGQVDAALVTLPVHRKGLLVQNICQEEMLVCLRRDDPAASQEAIPQNVVTDRFRVMVDRSHHPLFYDKLMRKFGKAGIDLHPSECVSSPAELQYLITEGAGFGLVRESATLAPELTTRPIANLALKISTAFICLKEEAHPLLPLLGSRMALRCKSKPPVTGLKKPPARVTEIFEERRRLMVEA